MTKQQLETLEQAIFASFWRANEMTRKQAEDYAALAVSHFKRAVAVQAANYKEAV